MSEGSLRDGRVRLFLGAQAISAIGTWSTFIAIWGYAVYEFDASAADVSLYGVAFAAPQVLLGPVAGAAVDRFGARRTLGAAELLGVVASLLLITAGDFRTLALLSAVHGVCAAFLQPALQSLPPRLVGDAELAKANSLIALTETLAIVLGPVVGGLTITWFGFRGAFVFDAFTYLVGFTVLPLLRVRPLAAAPHDDDANRGFRAAAEGWRLVVRSPILRRTVIAATSVHLLYGVSLLSEPLYVRDVLDRTPATFASLQAVFGLCLVASGVLVARLGDRVSTFGWIAIGAAGSGLTSIIYLGTPWLVVAYLGVALWGLFTALVSGPVRTVLQRNTPESAHGRVMAADLVATSAARLVGTAAAGVVIDALEVPRTMILVGTAVALLAIVLDRRQRVAPGFVAAAPGAVDVGTVGSVLAGGDERRVDDAAVVVEGTIQW